MQLKTPFLFNLYLICVAVGLLKKRELSRLNESHRCFILHSISWIICLFLSVYEFVRACIHLDANVSAMLWLSASCPSWTTHEHICQCHEVEPFLLKAGNLFPFPRVFLESFFIALVSYREPIKMCNKILLF